MHYFEGRGSQVIR